MKKIFLINSRKINEEDFYEELHAELRIVLKEYRKTHKVPNAMPENYTIKRALKNVDDEIEVLVNGTTFNIFKLNNDDDDLKNEELLFLLKLREIDHIHMNTGL